MTLVDILQIILFVMALMIFHESGHVISAKIMGLDIQKISFQLKHSFNHYIDYIVCYIERKVTVILILKLIIFKL